MNYSDALYRLNPYSPAYPHKYIKPELTLRLIAAHFPDCIEGSVLQFWDTMTIEVFETVIETWITRENINLFDDSPILCAMRSMQWDSPPWPTKLRWIKSIQKLIKMGADIHRLSRSSKVSLLHEVLSLTKAPYDVPEAFTFWISILTSSGVGITQYLKVEGDFYYDNAPIFIEVPDEDLRILTLQIHDDGDAHFGWEWWVDTHGPGYELAKEFKHFEAIMFYNPNRDLEYTGDYDFDLYLKLRDERRYHQQLREERFWSKKAAKESEEQNKNPIQLPGAWID